MRTSSTSNTKNQVTIDETQTITGAKTFSSNIIANGTTGVIGNITGNLTANGGSASSPSVTFVSNLNTGIYQSTSNSLSVTTAGVERIKFNNDGLTIVSGQLIIPTSTPASPINGSIWIS